MTGRDRLTVNVPASAGAPRAQTRQWRLMRRCATACVAVAVPLTSRLDAQTVRTIVAAPAYQSWTFDKAVPLDSLRVLDASQLSAPFVVSMPFASNWSASLSGAAFSSTVNLDATGSSASRKLSGVTDLRLRVSGPITGDALQFTVGVNLPTGNRSLSIPQNDVLRVLAAPALGAQVAVPGVGLGATVGVIAAGMRGNWSLAAGASVEHRGSYSPLDAIIAGRNARTELAPGAAAHLSFGADGQLGVHRLTIGLLGDVYTKDEVRSITASGTRTDNYRLGPTALATAALQIGGTGFRELTIRVTNRYRSAFSDNTGATIAGSNGNYLDGGISAVLGAPDRVALVFGVDGSTHTGLSVDNGFVGAGLTAAGFSVGLSVPSGNFELRPTARYAVGTLKTNRVTTSMTSITAGLSISTR